MKTVSTPGIKYIRNNNAVKLFKLQTQHNKAINIFIGKKLTKKYKETFLMKYLYEDEGFILLHYKNDPFWSQILRDVGIAKSLSQANGAGWNRKVDFGFQDIFLDGLKIRKEDGAGKQPHRIVILKEKVFASLTDKE